MINLTGRPRPASSTDTIEVFKSLVGASYPRPYSYTASARLDLARLASASTSDGEMIVTDAAIGEGWCPRVARGHLLILIAPGASRALRLLCLFQALAAAAPEQRVEFGVVKVTSDTQNRKTCSTAISSILIPARMSL
jgi:hypothetical protein